MLGHPPGSIVAMRPLKDEVIAELRRHRGNASLLHRQGAGQAYAPGIPSPRVSRVRPERRHERRKRAVFEATITAGARQALPHRGAWRRLPSAPACRWTARQAPWSSTSEAAPPRSPSSRWAASSRRRRSASRAIRSIPPSSSTKTTHCMAIGERTAEDQDHHRLCGSARRGSRRRGPRSRPLRPAHTVRIESEDVREGAREPVSKMIQAVKDTMDETPPRRRLTSWRYSITLTGGGGMLRGLDRTPAREDPACRSVSDTALIQRRPGVCRRARAPDFLSQPYSKQQR